MLIRTAMIVALLGVPGGWVHGQDRLEAVAAEAKRAWGAHRVGAMMRATETVQVQLPGSRPLAAMSPGQAVATLQAFLGRAVEVEVRLMSARNTGGGRGYVELRRLYREPGTQAVQSQRVLLGYRERAGEWILVEVRVLD